MGQGGGPPHLHGDPFGARCLYDARNYTLADGVTTSLDAHPPIIGWSLDGPSNYGRYEEEPSPFQCVCVCVCVVLRGVRRDDEKGVVYVVARQVQWQWQWQWQ